MREDRKPKVRRGAGAALLTTLGAIVGTVATNPAIVQSKTGIIGLGAAALGSLIQAFTKPAVRSEHER